jgi:hypothetical protein
LNLIRKKEYAIIREFVPLEEVDALCKITDFYFIEVLNDYILFCERADRPFNPTTWSAYKRETEAIFR